MIRGASQRHGQNNEISTIDSRALNEFTDAYLKLKHIWWVDKITVISVFYEEKTLNLFLALWWVLDENFQFFILSGHFAKLPGEFKKVSTENAPWVESIGPITRHTIFFHRKKTFFVYWAEFRSHSNEVTFSAIRIILLQSCLQMQGRNPF